MARFTAKHRRWITLNALLIPAVVNVLLNGGIAWLSAAGAKRVPLWAAPISDGPSTITDSIGTLLLLPAITNLLVTTAIGRDLRSGRLPPLQLGQELPVVPRNRTPRGLALAAVCVAGLGPAVVGRPGCYALRRY